MDKKSQAHKLCKWHDNENIEKWSLRWLWGSHYLFLQCGKDLLLALFQSVLTMLSCGECWDCWRCQHTFWRLSPVWCQHWSQHCCSHGYQTDHLTGSKESGSKVKLWDVEKNIFSMGWIDENSNPLRCVMKVNQAFVRLFACALHFHPLPNN